MNHMPFTPPRGEAMTLIIRLPINGVVREVQAKALVSPNMPVEAARGDLNRMLDDALRCAEEEERSNCHGRSDT